MNAPLEPAVSRFVALLPGETTTSRTRSFGVKDVPRSVSGLPRTLKLTADEVRKALEEPVAQILEAIRVTLERTPPELASDIMDRGIMMSGGGSLLLGLDRPISKETGMPVHISEDAVMCVAKGTGKVLDLVDTLRALRKK